MCDNFLKAENQNYVVNTKDFLSLVMESIILRTCKFLHD